MIGEAKFVKVTSHDATIIFLKLKIENVIRNLDKSFFTLDETFKISDKFVLFQDNKILKILSVERTKFPCSRPNFRNFG